MAGLRFDGPGIQSSRSVVAQRSWLEEIDEVNTSSTCLRAVSSVSVAAGVQSSAIVSAAFTSSIATTRPSGAET